jgi:hypothetical protein
MRAAWCKNLVRLRTCDGNLNRLGAVKFGHARDLIEDHLITVLKAVPTLVVHSHNSGIVLDQEQEVRSGET